VSRVEAPPERKIIVEGKERKLRLFYGSPWLITPERFLTLIKPYLNEEEEKRIEAIINNEKALLGIAKGKGKIKEVKKVLKKIKEYGFSSLSIKKILRLAIKDYGKRIFLESLFGSLSEAVTYYEDEEGRLYPSDYPSEIVLSR